MNIPLEITSLTKIFPTSAGAYVAVQDFNARIEAGEFICLLGHSGCGKSTVLSILAGLDQATTGGICIDGREVNTPGTDRGVVFQAPSLLPWLTAQENVSLAVEQAFPKFSRRQRMKQAMKCLEMVGIAEFASQTSAELSFGTQQRVSLARALGLDPRFLLLDEPFGMLDSLTRYDLQEVLLRVWEQSQKTIVMVTHDVDEALYVATRILLMTDGPAGRVGKILPVPFSRPRNRARVLQHADYSSLRRTIIEFLENHAHQSATHVAN